MRRFERNRRLYDYLFAMGLVVDPVLTKGNPDKIDCLIVSAAPRKLNVDQLPASDVASPMQGSEVGKR